MIGIYSITNTINGKNYVGQSVDVQQRLRTHRRNLRLEQHSNPHLQSAWNKYGEEAFQFKLLCECAESDLDNLEARYIADWRALHTDHGYNLERVVEGSKRHSQESKDKIRAAKLGVPRPPELAAQLKMLRKGVTPSKEAVAKMLATTQSNKDAGLWEHKPGKPMSDEAKARISALHKGKKMDPKVVAKRSETRRNLHLHPVVSEKTKEKLRQTMLGRKHSPETKAKMSAALKGRKPPQERIEKMKETKKGKDYRTPEAKEKMRLANLGRISSEETRAKLSAAKKGHKRQQPLTDEMRQNLRNAQLGRKHSPEACEKIRTAKKIYWETRRLGSLGKPCEDIHDGVVNDKPA